MLLHRQSLSLKKKLHFLNNDSHDNHVLVALEKLNLFCNKINKVDIVKCFDIIFVSKETIHQNTIYECKILSQMVDLYLCLEIL